jgi:hypothetical protein
MEGAWSWAYRIQAIHSHSLILCSIKLFMQFEEQIMTDEKCWMNNQCLRDEGLIVYPIV